MTVKFTGQRAVIPNGRKFPTLTRSKKKRTCETLHDAAHLHEPAIIIRGDDRLPFHWDTFAMSPAGDFIMERFFAEESPRKWIKYRMDMMQEDGLPEEFTRVEDTLWGMCDSGTIMISIEGIWVTFEGEYGSNRVATIFVEEKDEDGDDDMEVPPVDWDSVIEKILASEWVAV